MIPDDVYLCLTLMRWSVLTEHCENRTFAELRDALRVFFPDEVIQSALDLNAQIPEEEGE